MARFRSIGCIVIGAVKYPPGQVFADGPGSALPGDVVWSPYPPGLTKDNVGLNLAPLDAGARSIVANSRFANEVPWPTCGASSIS